MKLYNSLLMAWFSCMFGLMLLGFVSRWLLLFVWVPLVTFSDIDKNTHAWRELLK